MGFFPKQPALSLRTQKVPQSQENQCKEKGKKESQPNTPAVDPRHPCWCREKKRKEIPSAAGGGREGLLTPWPFLQAGEICPDVASPASQAAHTGGLEVLWVLKVGKQNPELAPGGLQPRFMLSGVSSSHLLNPRCGVVVASA